MYIRFMNNCLYIVAFLGKLSIRLAIHFKNVYPFGYTFLGALSGHR